MPTGAGVGAWGWVPRMLAAPRSRERGRFPLEAVGVGIPVMLS